MGAAVLLMVLTMLAGAQARRALLQEAIAVPLPVLTCKGPGIFPVGNCSPYFYNCGTAGTEASAQPCADTANTVFNPATQTCDFTANVAGCPVDATKCPSAGLFPVAHCAPAFYSCSGKGATPVEMPCPATTFFGAPNTTCNTLDNVLGCTCTTVTAAANQTKELSILSAALAATGLNETLDDPYLNATVFAPTDAAFKALLAFLGWTPEQALNATNLPVVKKILLVHVVPGVAAYSSSLTNNQSLPTLLGQNLTVTVKGGAISVQAPGGEAGNVIIPNVTACSAVVHVIDRVLLPQLPATGEGKDGLGLGEEPAGGSIIVGANGVQTANTCPTGGWGSDFSCKLTSETPLGPCATRKASANPLVPFVSAGSPAQGGWPGAIGTTNCKCAELYMQAGAQDPYACTACKVCSALQTGTFASGFKCKTGCTAPYPPTGNNGPYFVNCGTDAAYTQKGSVQVADDVWNVIKNFSC